MIGIEIAKKKKKKTPRTNGTTAAMELEIEIYLDSMLEAVELPAGVADLDTGLSDVDRNALSHLRSET